MWVHVEIITTPYFSSKLLCHIFSHLIFKKSHSTGRTSWSFHAIHSAWLVFQQPDALLPLYAACCWLLSVSRQPRNLSWVSESWVQFSASMYRWIFHRHLNSTYLNTHHPLYHTRELCFCHFWDSPSESSILDSSLFLQISLLKYLLAPLQTLSPSSLPRDSLWPPLNPTFTELFQI